MNQEMMFRICVIDSCLRKVSYKWICEMLVVVCNEQAWEYFDLDCDYIVFMIFCDLKRMKVEFFVGFGVLVEWDVMYKMYWYVDVFYVFD